MPTRRQMLKVAINSSALVTLSRTVPAFLAQSARAAVPGRDGRVLVVIQLEGGNDAINTLVPFADEGYARNRKVLRIPEKGLIRVDDRVGLHPALRGWVTYWTEVTWPRAGRWVSQSKSLALSKHGDLADSAARPRGIEWAGLDRS